jgi:hypothetical protein
MSSLSDSTVRAGRFLEGRTTRWDGGPPLVLGGCTACPDGQHWYQ